MADTQKLPAPPRLIPALVAGFDAIANHIFLILFPVGLDLILWFAPHLRIKDVLTTFIAEMQRMAANAGPELNDIFLASRDAWQQISKQINLLLALRSYPVGVPSLMVSWLPIDTPLGSPRMLEIPNIGLALILMLAFGLFGLALGSLYYSFVSHVSLHGQLGVRDALIKWPDMFLQVLLLAFVWILLLVGVSIPASCFISLGTFISGPSLGQIGFLMFAALMIWLIFPLLFSAHGIFVNQQKVMLSIRQGVRITNSTLPTTGLFILIAMLLSQGFDLLWRVTPENSWLTLIGLTGHAFITTGLLAASFIYYRDADRWVASLAQHFAGSSRDTST